MRDKRKDEKYFIDFIKYQKNRILKKEDKLNKTLNDKDKKNRINLSLVKYKLDLLIAQFSYGIDIDELLYSLDSVIKTATEMDTVDYETTLNILSIAVLLEAKNKKIKDFISKHSKFINEDKLLKFISSYLCDGSLIWDGKFVLGNIYDKLNDLMENEDKEEVLFRYLNVWYIDRKDASWHESHKGINNTYVGYWSFETASIVKILGVNDEKLKINDFYPVL